MQLRTPRHHVIFALSALAAVAVLVLSSTAGRAETINGRCTPSKVRFVSSDDTPSTTSTTFTNVTGATTSFVQGGTSPSCVIVNFSAQSSTAPNTPMRVGATLDGVANALPTDVQLDYNSIYYLPKSVNFIFPNVAPGSHRVRIQFRSENPGGSVSLKDFNLVIHHAP